mmetsp:Transcript_24202/g.52192  ORF Transcript_24202/g.52192 Transcript_24202/m.52192 type:complete len:276 (+) Transcript_24202:314-1141(+)
MPKTSEASTGTTTPTIPSNPPLHCHQAGHSSGMGTQSGARVTFRIVTSSASMATKAQPPMAQLVTAATSVEPMAIFIRRLSDACRGLQPPAAKLRATRLSRFAPPAPAAAVTAGASRTTHPRTGRRTPAARRCVRRHTAAPAKPTWSRTAATAIEPASAATKRVAGPSGSVRTTSASTYTAPNTPPLRCHGFKPSTFRSPQIRTLANESSTPLRMVLTAAAATGLSSAAASAALTAACSGTSEPATAEAIEAAAIEAVRISIAYPVGAGMNVRAG